MKKQKKRKKYQRHHEKSNIENDVTKLGHAQALELDRRKFKRRKVTNILQEAEFLVYEVRNKDYKHPMQNFTNIANLWNAYLGAMGRENLLINNVDIAALNILQKVARISTNQKHQDSWLDIAGYAACAERILKNQ